ncbi:hypothetical protein [Rhodococcus sp. O3]|uniref:hypothetical protein n=1 Tax=Rhodococcus sp. O3 TaxID=3404919 RepID=UPI003B67A970
MHGLTVLLLTAVAFIGLAGVAAASGFDCKEVPSPQFPNEVLETVFDSTSADRPARDGSTGYETYGWAGLDWYVYDLGCGEDLVRAPDAVLDTNYGNLFLGIGKSMAAAAFWLDDQTKTGQAATDAGVAPVLSQFDKIVYSITAGMRAVYWTWLGVALAVVSVLVLWNALKADSAGVTRTSAVAALGLMLGALLIGAPQKALQISDDTFGSLVTETQDQIFSVRFGGGEGNGTLVSGGTNPRDVLLDQIFLEDWRKGWFGTNYDPTDPAQLGPRLRNSLAFSYAEQQQVKGDPTAQAQLAKDKADQFKEIVSSLEEDYQLSYYQFQGKNSGRAGTGFMAMLKLAMPSLLWIGASVLKLTALLAIRFAVLFAPLWIPVAIAHGGWLSRVLRTLGSAYLWGVAGAAVVGLYLMALVSLYVHSGGDVDGTWRLWILVLLTVAGWAFLRPFKRMSQTLTQNRTSMLNRKARNAQKTLRRKLFTSAATAIGGPGAGAAVGTAQTVSDLHRRRTSGEIAGLGGVPVPARPEGRSLNNQRQQALTKSRADARKSQSSGRARRLDQASAAATERDVRLAGIAAMAGRDAARGKAESPDAEKAMRIGATVWKRIDTSEAEEQQLDRRARRDLLTAGVGQRWDGGDRSAIAPMKVYTPGRPHRSGRNARTDVLASPTVRRQQQQEPSQNIRVWTAPTPGSHRQDRYS